MVAILWSMADWRPVTLSTNSLLSFFSDDTGGGGGGGGGGRGHDIWVIWVPGEMAKSPWGTRLNISPQGVIPSNKSWTP